MQVEHGSQGVILKQAIVFEELVDGGSARSAHREAQQQRFVKGGNPFSGAELFHDFAKISRQRALPTESIDAVSKRGGDQFLKTVHALNAGIIRRQGERSHTHGCRWFTPAIPGFHPNSMHRRILLRR